eukprot:Skav207083  [mRNA]  locus=scaffold4452:27779:29659:+ [translate_table: standard]
MAVTECTCNVGGCVEQRRRIWGAHPWATALVAVGLLDNVAQENSRGVNSAQSNMTKGQVRSMSAVFAPRTHLSAKRHRSASPCRRYRHHWHHRHHCLPWDVLPVNAKHLQIVTASRVKTLGTPAKQDLLVIGGGASPDLTGVTVKIPSSSELDGVTYYEVQVTPRKGAPWRVFRRFRHFSALAIQLGKLPQPLPPKLWTRKAHQDAEVMEERRKGLELWLRSAADSAELSFGSALAKFLLLGRCGGARVDLDPAELPRHVQLLEVVVPSRLGADDLLQVKVPGSEVITISIPWGAPGTHLKLWWEPMCNTLAVHHWR